MRPVYMLKDLLSGAKSNFSRVNRVTRVLKKAGIFDDTIDALLDAVPGVSQLELVLEIAKIAAPVLIDLVDDDDDDDDDDEYYDEGEDPLLVEEEEDIDYPEVVVETKVEESDDVGFDSYPDADPLDVLELSMLSMADSIQELDLVKDSTIDLDNSRFRILEDSISLKKQTYVVMMSFDLPGEE